MGPREQVFAALFALAQNLEWVDPTTSMVTTLLFSSRRVKSFDDLPNTPALCQAEGDETIVQMTNLPSKQTLKAHWIIYHRVGANKLATPASTNNEIMDAALALLEPPPGADRQTLGGLAYDVRAEGKVFKDPGDLDTQGLVVIPITILLP